MVPDSIGRAYTSRQQKGKFFVLRADGSVIGAKGGRFNLTGDPLKATLLAGDTIIVPERSIGGGISMANPIYIPHRLLRPWQALFLAIHY